jgi:hypothetical protein
MRAGCGVANFAGIGGNVACFAIVLMCQSSVGRPDQKSLKRLPYNWRHSPEDFTQAGLVLEYLQELRQWRNCPPYYPQADKSGDHEVVLLRREGVGGLSGNSPRR